MTELCPVLACAIVCKAEVLCRDRESLSRQDGDSARVRTIGAVHAIEPMHAHNVGLGARARTVHAT